MQMQSRYWINSFRNLVSNQINNEIIELKSEYDLIISVSSLASISYMNTGLKQATSLNFKPFIPLAGYEEDVKEIRTLIDEHQYEEAIKLAQELITLSISGLHYFQTYDWFFLMGTVTMGYLGWMVYILLYTSFLFSPFKSVMKSPVRRRRVIVSACIITSVLCKFLYETRGSYKISLSCLSLSCIY